MLTSMLTFTTTRTDDPIAAELLAGYFQERSETFPEAQGSYRVTSPPPAAFVPPAGDFLVVADGDEAVGCGGIRRIADDLDGTGAPRVRFEIKHLWLVPAARGHGSGRAVLAELEKRAIALGADRLVLDTNESLVAAGNLYRTSGYSPIAPYNDNPNATNWYGKDVVAPER